MLPVTWGLEAREQLAEILDFISDHSEIAANEMADLIDHSTSNLPNHPYLYRIGRVDGTREMVVHANYVIVYRVLVDAIDIVAVLHTRQQYPR